MDSLSYLVPLIGQYICKAQLICHSHWRSSIVRIKSSMLDTLTFMNVIVFILVFNCIKIVQPSTLPQRQFKYTIWNFSSAKSSIGIIYIYTRGCNWKVISSIQMKLESFLTMLFKFKSVKVQNYCMHALNIKFTLLKRQP